LLAVPLLLGGCAAAGSEASPPAAAMAGGAGRVEAGVAAAVDRLFDAMRAGDSVSLRAVMHPQARLLTVSGTAGRTELREETVDAFAAAVGTARAEVWDERATDLRVEVDGDLASAWMGYRFYVGERFSHCGVNAMHLHRQSGEWRIVHLVDTRRREGCGEPGYG
jgi:hypothetical protein